MNHEPITSSAFGERYGSFSAKRDANFQPFSAQAFRFQTEIFAVVLSDQQNSTEEGEFGSFVIHNRFAEYYYHSM